MNESKKLKEALASGNRLEIARWFQKGSPDKEWWNRNAKGITGLRYRDTKAAARFAEFLDENEIETEGF